MFIMIIVIILRVYTFLQPCAGRLWAYLLPGDLSWLPRQLKNDVVKEVCAHCTLWQYCQDFRFYTVGDEVNILKTIGSIWLQIGNVNILGIPLSLFSATLVPIVYNCIISI